MRKINKKAFTTLLLCLILPLYAAEENTNANTEDNSTSAEVGTSNENSQRNLPSSQAVRIQGLINQLNQNSRHEIQSLSYEGENFLALFRDASTGDPQGCILLLHGNNEHPDWPSVINPIRTKLNENSWCTVSIEIPDVYPKEAITVTSSEEETISNINLPNEEVIYGRINAALEFIANQNYQTLALLGHKTGASYALKYAADNNLTEGALLLIAPMSPSSIDSFDMSQTIAGVNIPILDYYFDVSAKEVRFAQERQSAANRRQDRSLIYQQIKALPDQRYQLAGEKRLTQRVWGFLKQNTQQKSQQRPLPSISKGLFHPNEF